MPKIIEYLSEIDKLEMKHFGFTETQRFVKHAEKILGEEKISELQLYLCKYPDDGAIIPNSGGIRKIRWAGSDRGKRGGARIIIILLTKQAGFYCLIFMPKMRRKIYPQVL